MPIVAASDTFMRHRVFSYLNNLRKQKPDLTVLDLGGAANPWCDEYVTTYIDFQEVNTSKEVVQGDLMDEKFWKSISHRKWNFVICTHVLEDIRDPLFLIRWMQKISSAGFIAVPNKHTEMSSVESPQYPGYFHHRWLFALKGQVLRAVAKLALLGYYRETNSWLHRLYTGSKLQRRLADFFAPRAIPTGGMVPWFNPEKAKHGFELSFIWERGFDFEYLDNDYCGPDQEAMLRRYIKDLGEGF